MIRIKRRFDERSLSAVVYIDNVICGSVAALWSDVPAVAVTWRVADVDGNVLGDHTGDYLEAEQLLLRGTTL